MSILMNRLAIRFAVLVSLTAALLAFGGLGSTAQAGAINLIKDGTFQSTSLSSPGGYICSTVGSTCVSALTYWQSSCAKAGNCGTSATPSSLLFAGTNGSAWNGNRGLYGTVTDAPLGGNTVAIDGDSNYSTTLSQTVSGLQIGDRYQLTFYMAAAQQKGLTGATTETWQVNFGSSTWLSQTLNNPSKSYTPWIEQSTTFLATATSEVLTFLALGTPSGEPPICLLGDVSMYDVPEPPAILLMMAGLAGLALMLRAWSRA